MNTGSLQACMIGVHHGRAVLVAHTRNKNRYTTTEQVSMTNKNVMTHAGALADTHIAELVRGLQAAIR